MNKHLTLTPAMLQSGWVDNQSSNEQVGWSGSESQGQGIIFLPGTCYRVATTESIRGPVLLQLPGRGCRAHSPQIIKIAGGQSILSMEGLSFKGF